MSISVVLARGLLAEVERSGGDAGALLAQSELDGARLSDLRQMLSLPEIDRLVQRAVALTGDPALGFAIAEHAPDTMLQVVGQLVLSQTTLRRAFSVLQRYSDLLAEGVTWSLEEQADLAVLRCSPPWFGETTRCFMDFALAMAARIGQHFSNGRGSLVEVHLQHPEPDYVARYQSVFGCPVLFGQDTYALVFPRSYLDLLQSHADATMAESADALADRLLHERQRTLSTAERVLTLLHYERDWDKIDVQRIARRLGLSVRALRRRLNAEQAPMSSLLDETRCRIACEALSRPDRSVKEVSELLGFSEPSAFHRAFRRWTGRTPGEYVKFDRFRPAAELVPPPPRIALVRRPAVRRAPSVKLVRSASR